jgi:hypothetical protein
MPRLHNANRECHRNLNVHCSFFGLECMLEIASSQSLQVVRTREVAESCGIDDMDETNKGSTFGDTAASTDAANDGSGYSASNHGVKTPGFNHRPNKENEMADASMALSCKQLPAGANVLSASALPTQQVLSVMSSSNQANNIMPASEAATTSMLVDSSLQEQEIAKPQQAKRGKELSRLYRGPVVTPAPRLLMLDTNSSVGSETRSQSTGFKSPNLTRLTTPRSVGSTSGSRRPTNANTRGGVLATVRFTSKGNVANLKVITEHRRLTFPESLEAMLADAEAKGSRAFRWAIDGTAFAVDSTRKEEVSELLLQYFSRKLSLVTAFVQKNHYPHGSHLPHVVLLFPYRF